MVGIVNHFNSDSVPLSHQLLTQPILRQSTLKIIDKNRQQFVTHESLRVLLYRIKDNKSMD